MRGWEKVSDRQSEVVRFLVNSYHKNRLVHAYILEGAKGVGKLFVAKNFAKMLLCESEDKICGTCRSCQMIENEGHVNDSDVAIGVFKDGGGEFGEGLYY